MEIINNRYKIESIFSKEKNGTTYLVSDLFNNNSKILLKIYNNIEKNHFIEYLINEFDYLKSYKHEVLQEIYDFDIIETINNTYVTESKYFYTKEYINNKYLYDFTEKLSIKNIKSILIKLLDISEYFQFRGYCYNFFDFKNIKITNSPSNIKIMDLVSTKEYELSNVFKINNSLDNIVVNKLSDNMIKYIGNIGELLINNNNQKNSEYDNLLEVIKRMKNGKYKNYFKVIKDINLSKNEVDLKGSYKNIQTINYSPKIIGRDKEINFIRKVKNEIENFKNDIRIITISGEEGIGKSKFIDDITNKLRLCKTKVFKTKLDENREYRLKPFKEIIRLMIKNCEKSLIKKYGSELVKIIPEIKNTRNILPTPSLSIEKEKLRLFDRISKFLIDYSNNMPLFIAIDDFYKSDNETIELLSFIIKNINKSNIVFLLSYDIEKLLTNKKAYQFILSIENKEYYTNLEMTKLNLEETNLLIKNILGMKYIPFEFSQKILKESKGNPRYIEQIIRNLYISEELYINKFGELCYIDEFINLKIPSNINDVIIKQVNYLNEDLLNLLQVISCFNTSISIKVIKRIIDKDKKRIEKMLNKLIENKLVIKMVEDLGFTYELSNINLKNYIYNKLTKEKRMDIHKKASKIIENLLKNENRTYSDELIHHLVKSNQIEKAIKYCIYIARNLQSNSIFTESLIYWNKANKMIGSKVNFNKVEILFNLGVINQIQGKYDISLLYYKHAINLSIEMKNSIYVSLCKNKIANIYYEKNNFIESETFAREAQLLAKQINYIDGLLESQITLNRIRLANGNRDKVLEDSSKYLVLAEEEHKHNYIGELLNQIGVVQMFLGQFEKAEKYFNKSIKQFKLANEYIGTTRVMNNLAIIYKELYNDVDKALKIFNNGLEISQRNNNFQASITFLNNIGEIYFHDKHEFNKAQRYFKRILEIEDEIGLENILNSACINLAELSLKLGEYDECIKYYNLLNSKFENNQINWQDLSGYYEFLIKFYLEFEDYKNAIHYINLLEKDYSKYDIRIKLFIEDQYINIKFLRDKILDIEKINELRQKYDKTKLIIDRKYFLLRIAIYSLINKNYKYTKDILKEIKTIANESNTRYLDIIHKIVLLGLDKFPNKEEKVLYEKIKKTKIPKLNILANKIFGDTELRRKNYINAFNYYINTLETYHNLKKSRNNLRNVNKTTKSHFIIDIINKINEITRVLLNYEVAITLESEDLTTYEDGLIESYYEKVKTLINNSFYSEELKYVNSIEDLIKKFSSNQINNLKLILEFAMRETFADRGYIGLIIEEELKVIVNSHNDKWYINTHKILKEVEKNKEGKFKRNTSSDNFNFTDSINENIKSFMCLPIFNNNYNNDFEEKRNFNNDKGDLVGFIYLDTFKTFNKFNDKTYNKIFSLVNLILINIDNYNLRIISSLDKLTGAYTRKYFDSYFNKILVKAKKYNERFSVIMIDIDKFKHINDTYGHQKGDVILNKISNIMLSCVRKTDIVARYGGEEFIILMPGCDKENAFLIGEKIRSKVKKNKVLGEDRELTVSLGISTFPEDGIIKDELIEKADQALYYAKNNGRNRTIKWSEELSNSTMRFDKLAGIITGNTVEDQRKILGIIDIIELIRKKNSTEKKIFSILARIIEIIEAENGSIILTDEMKTYSRTRFKDNWTIDNNINKNIVKRVIESKKGEYLVDWENVKDKDLLTGNPNFKSIIIVPLINNGVLKGVLYFSVPIKEKEFDYNSYNYVKIVGNIISSII